MPEESAAEIKQVTPANGPTEKLKKTSFPQYREGAETIKPLIESSGILSHESKIKLETSTKRIQGSTRTLALRRIRREIMDALKKTPDVQVRKELVDQGHARDEIAEEFMSGQKKLG